MAEIPTYLELWLYECVLSPLCPFEIIPLDSVVKCSDSSEGDSALNMPPHFRQRQEVYETVLGMVHRGYLRLVRESPDDHETLSFESASIKDSDAAYMVTRDGWNHWQRFSRPRFSAMVSMAARHQDDITVHAGSLAAAVKAAYFLSCDYRELRMLEWSEAEVSDLGVWCPFNELEVQSGVSLSVPMGPVTYCRDEECPDIVRRSAMWAAICGFHGSLGTGRDSSAWTEFHLANYGEGVRWHLERTKITDDQSPSA